MENNELLSALATLIDNKLEPINVKLDKLDNRLDSLETRMGGLETRMDGLETRMGGLETRMDDVENDVKAVKLTLETETNKNIKLLAEGYLSLNTKVNKIDNDTETLKFDTVAIRAIVTSHQSILNELPKAK